MKILIIEDEPSLRELIQRSLEKERYVVEAAADFQSGLRKIEDYDYDCVLLDIMLPDGNGLNLLEQLKKMPIPSSVISAGSLSSNGTCMFCSTRKAANPWSTCFIRATSTDPQLSVK